LPSNARVKFRVIVDNREEEWRKKKKPTKEEKKEAEKMKTTGIIAKKRATELRKSFDIKVKNKQDQDPKMRLDTELKEVEEAELEAKKEDEMKGKKYGYVFASGSFVLFDSNLILKQGLQKMNLFEFEDIDNRVLCQTENFFNAKNQKGFLIKQ